MLHEHLYNPGGTVPVCKAASSGCVHHTFTSITTCQTTMQTHKGGNSTGTADSTGCIPIGVAGPHKRLAKGTCPFSAAFLHYPPSKRSSAACKNCDTCLRSPRQVKAGLRCSLRRLYNVQTLAVRLLSAAFAHSYRSSPFYLQHIVRRCHAAVRLCHSTLWLLCVVMPSTWATAHAHDCPSNTSRATAERGNGRSRGNRERQVARAKTSGSPAALAGVHPWQLETGADVLRSNASVAADLQQVHLCSRPGLPVGCEGRCSPRRCDQIALRVSFASSSL